MTDKIEWLKQELNRELSREGKLQRAGLRKCRVIFQKENNANLTLHHKVDILNEQEKVILTKNWSIESEREFFETDNNFYYHGIEGTEMVLETEGGVLFRYKGFIRFIT